MTSAASSFCRRRSIAGHPYGLPNQRQGPAPRRAALEVSEVASNFLAMSREASDVYVCEVCRKPVSRMFRCQRTDRDVRRPCPTKDCPPGLLRCPSGPGCFDMADLALEQRVRRNGRRTRRDSPERREGFLAHATRELTRALGRYSELDPRDDMPRSARTAGLTCIGVRARTSTTTKSSRVTHSPGSAPAAEPACSGLGCDRARDIPAPARREEK